ncbi:MAG: DUF4124 domain-containing protein [Methylotenera sp.]|uniref:DUF4124 domain-containing protein n=1 Tax=Methylotenera sp. TaxID=2051956 RepID=UPI002489A23D|nr:DUF4124 domain-containing protein [Methylotenera sp.]MDI1307934.1 DUF4124 domain-containing protein [Methylotenera sp.]
MVLRILLLCVVLLPTLASAEIYKWKDIDGVIRYSDVPPPSNVPQEALYGKKIPRPTVVAPVASVESTTANIANKETNSSTAKTEVKVSDAKTKEEAAKKRAQAAETKKQDEEQKKAELETKQASCSIAKQNFGTYNNGGRISKTDENGNRQYLSEADIEQGKADAQKDIEKYCD